MQTNKKSIGKQVRKGLSAEGSGCGNLPTTREAGEVFHRAAFFHKRQLEAKPRWLSKTLRKPTASERFVHSSGGSKSVKSIL